jgi:hypothetical protein
MDIVVIGMPTCIDVGGIPIIELNTLLVPKLVIYEHFSPTSCIWGRSSTNSCVVGALLVPTSNSVTCGVNTVAKSACTILLIAPCLYYISMILTVCKTHHQIPNYSAPFVQASGGAAA